MFLFFKEIWFSTLDYSRITWRSLKTAVPIPHARTSAGASPLYLPVPHTRMPHVQLRLRTTASRSHINKEKAELLGMEKRSFLEGTLGYPSGLFPKYFLFRPSLTRALEIRCSLGTAPQFPSTSEPQHHLRKQRLDWKTKGEGEEKVTHNHFRCYYSLLKWSLSISAGPVRIQVWRNFRKLRHEVPSVIHR